MKTNSSQIKFDDYIKELLGEKEAKKLKNALRKTIIITGPQGATGKTALTSILRKKGYSAVEGWLTHEVRLDKPLPELIPDIKNEIS